MTQFGEVVGLYCLISHCSGHMSEIVTRVCFTWRSKCQRGYMISYKKVAVTRPALQEGNKSSLSPSHTLSPHEAPHTQSKLWYAATTKRRFKQRYGMSHGCDGLMSVTSQMVTNQTCAKTGVALKQVYLAGIGKHVTLTVTQPVFLLLFWTTLLKTGTNCCLYRDSIIRMHAECL